MTDTKSLQYTFVNQARMANTKLQGKPVTVVGKVDKVTNASEFVLRSSDGKFSFLEICTPFFLREISLFLSD